MPKLQRERLIGTTHQTLRDRNAVRCKLCQRIVAGGKVAAILEGDVEPHWQKDITPFDRGEAGARTSDIRT